MRDRCLNSVLNVKAVVAAFNQEKALVGAFSVLVKTGCETDGSFHSTNLDTPDTAILRRAPASPPSRDLAFSSPNDGE